jgi:hypothetical protein
LPAVTILACARHRALGAVAALGVVFALCGCQVKLRVDTRVHADGSGVVTVAVGLDHDAVTKAGDLHSQLRVEDLTKAGWKVTGPSVEKDGYTWVRATKPFTDAAQATEIMNEINGADGAFRDWKVTRSSSLWATSWSATGTVDLTRGMQTFSDPKLSAALGAGGFDEVVKSIEAREGRPAADMVDVAVSVEVPGASHVYSPSLADRQATPVKVTSSKASSAAAIVGGVAVLAGLALVLVLLRNRYRHAHQASGPEAAERTDTTT